MRESASWWHTAHLSATTSTLNKGEHGTRVQSFDLFSRMMANEDYHSHLFADISAVTLRNRLPEVLRAIIKHDDWHSRWLNGFDYPLPGVLPLISPRKWAQAGLLDGALTPVLNPIQNYNPL